MPVCGNGIVDVGEDCDCGLNKVIYFVVIEIQDRQYYENICDR
jgi:hypothetical protein